MASSLQRSASILLLAIVRKTLESGHQKRHCDGVAGDNKQLPPTTFFASADDGDDDDLDATACQMAYADVTRLTILRRLNQRLAAMIADDYLTKPCCSAELKARLLTGHRILEREDRLVAAREEMRFKATHDSLTSLWDRGAIMSLLKNELHRAMRSETPVSVMLCDIDHFKQINDVYGHVAGDTVLQEVASRFMQSVRTYDAVGLYGDAVGRYGGEEFLLILSDCDAAQIRQRAENVRESIEKRPFQVNDSELSITVSIGFTTVTKWDKTQSIEGLLDRVDTALYEAKSSGRNRVIPAESLALV